MSTNLTTNLSTVTTETCEDWVIKGAIPQADTDISGIGVIIAFLLSAYITFAVVLVAYLLGAIDESLLRPVDLYVFKLPAQRRISPSWNKALHQCVLIFSDQQIVTGVAICIAGFVGLSSSISVYHFQIVIMLAWMSSSVHLSALTMLGEFFRDKPAVLGWRIAGMLVLFILLLVALVPTASNLWAVRNFEGDTNDETTGWAIPAKCYFFKTWGQGINPDAPLAYLLLILSYLWKIGALFRNSRNLFHRRIRGPPEHFLELILHTEALKSLKSKKRNPKLSLKYHMAMILYIILLAIFEFFASFAASLWLSIIGLIYGTIQIAIPREQNDWWNDKENEWGFGQIVPLILLIQPLGAILENYRSKRKTRHKSLPLPSSTNSSSSDQEETYELTARPTTPMLPPSSPSPPTAPSPSTPKKISQILATIPPQPPHQRSLEIPELHKPFYTTFLFASLVAWLQIGVAVISAVVFWLDAESIGFVASHSYYFVLVGLGAFVGVILVWTVGAVWWSRVFR